MDNQRDADAMTVAVEGDSLVAAPAKRRRAWVELTAGMIAQAGREATAVALLRPMWERDALDVGAALQLSRLHARAGEWDRAITLAREITVRWPEAARPHLFLGEFLAGRGDLEAGESEIRRAVALGADDPDNLLALISILSRRHPDLFTGRAAAGAVPEPVREVKELADRAAALLDDDAPLTVRMMLGATYQGLGDHETSIEFYERAAEDPELRRNALLNLSLACEETGRRDAALSALETLLADHPDDHVIQNALGYTLADHSQDLPRAESLIRSALKSEPDNPAYLDSLGWLLHRSGQPLEAFDYLVRATNALPEDPVILEHLGMVLLSLGRHDRAYEVFLRAEAVGGDSATLQVGPEGPPAGRSSPAASGEAAAAARSCAGLAAGLACAVAAYAAEPEPAASALEFGVVAWRVESLLADAAGTAAWVRCPDGTWRLDLARAEPGDPGTNDPEAGTTAAVLGRLGEGWTAAAPGDGTVVLQAWDGPLRTLEPAQAARLAALLSLSANGGDPGRAEVGPAVWRLRSGGPGHGRRVPWEEPAPRRHGASWSGPRRTTATSLLARDLASRGLGRGGAGESLAGGSRAGRRRAPGVAASTRPPSSSARPGARSAGGIRSRSCCPCGRWAKSSSTAPTDEPHRRIPVGTGAPVPVLTPPPTTPHPPPGATRCS